MFLNRQIRKRMEIRLRPCATEAGDFLYFPFDHHRGGVGYAVNAKDLEQAKAADWDPFSFVFVPTLLLGLLIAWLFDYDLIGSLLGLGLGVWLGILNYDWQKRRFDKFLSQLTPLPHRLTFKRYWMERSLQVSRFYIFVLCVFSVFLLILFIGTLIYGLSGHNLPQQILVLVLAALMTAYYGYRAFMLLTSRWKSRNLSLGQTEGLLPPLEREKP
jgi:hypothetical protein